MHVRSIANNSIEKFDALHCMHDKRVVRIRIQLRCRRETRSVNEFN